METCEQCKYEGYKECKCTLAQFQKQLDEVTKLRLNIEKLKDEVEALELKNRILQSTLDYFKTESEKKNFKMAEYYGQEES
jgi:hypothetical protein